MAYDDLFKGYREATRGLEVQAAQERERVMRDYDRQRNNLQSQLANTERDVQRTLGQLRTAERREQRRSDLPTSRPRDLGTRANIESVRNEGERYRREIRDLQTKVEQARGESVRDLERQTREAQRGLDKWYRDAKAAQREYERAVKAATVAPQSTVAPAHDDAAEYYREYAPKADPFKGATAKAGVGPSAGTVAFSGATAKAGIGPQIDTKASEAMRERIASGLMVNIPSTDKAGAKLPVIKAGLPAKYKAAAQPTVITKEMAKELSLSLIPVYGTIRYARQAKEGGYSGKEKAFIVLSVIGDVAIMVPVVKGVVSGIRAGATISSVLSKEALKKVVTGLVRDERGGIGTIVVDKVKAAPKLSTRLVQELDDIVRSASIQGRAKILAAKSIRAAKLAQRQQAAKATKAAIHRSKVRAYYASAKAKRVARNAMRLENVAQVSTQGAVKITPAAQAIAREAVAVAPEYALVVMAAMGTQLATKLGMAKGMTMPKIEQATQAAIEQMAQAQIVPMTKADIQAAADVAIQEYVAVRAQAASMIVTKSATRPAVTTTTTTAPIEDISISSAPQPEFATQTSQQAITATQVATDTPTKATTQTARITTTTTRTTTPRRLQPKRPRRPFKLKLPDGGSVELTPQQYAGIVAWKQGLFYIIVYPPYGKAQTVYTRKPVMGIQYGSGPGSPQRTARVVGGKLPRAFELAMGVTKVKVRPGVTRGRPRLKFRAREVVEPEMGEVRRLRK